MNKTVIIEGLIGVGKSTMSQLLAEELDGTLYPEPVVGNPYLEDYYRDPSRYALEMQFWLLTARYNAHLAAQYHVRHGAGTTIMDRSMYGDVAFAEVQHKLGYMDDRAMNSYLDTYQAMCAHALFPDVCVHLEVTPENAKRRIDGRSRACENGIEIKYLELLGKAIEHVVESLEQHNVRVIRVPYNEDQDPSQRIKTAKVLANVIRHSPPANTHDRMISRLYI